MPDDGFSLQQNGRIGVHDNLKTVVVALEWPAG